MEDRGISPEKHAMAFEFQVDMFNMLNDIITSGIMEGARNKSEGIKRLLETKDNSPTKNAVRAIYDWELRQLETRIPNLARISMFLLIYGYLETETHKVCLALNATPFHDEKNKVVNRIKPKDFSDKGLTRSIKYLNTVVNLELPDFFNSEQFLILNRLRNHFTHSFGVITKKEVEELNNLANVVPQASNLLIKQFDFEHVKYEVCLITLSDGFIRTFLETINSAFQELMQKVDDFVESEENEPE